MYAVALRVGYKVKYLVSLKANPHSVTRLVNLVRNINNGFFDAYDRPSDYELKERVFNWAPPGKCLKTCHRHVQKNRENRLSLKNKTCKRAIF